MLDIVGKRTTRTAKHCTFVETVIKKTKRKAKHSTLVDTRKKSKKILWWTQ